ncbi:MAG: small, acid-soluble spore protein, alpha/beta type [Clostridiaceae bacterium]
MSHKNNKNSKNNKKAGQKTKTELKEMKMEAGKEVGASNEKKKLGHESNINFIPYSRNTRSSSENAH